MSFEDEARRLEAASRAAIRDAARQLGNEAESQIRRNFKRKSANGFGSVKRYDLPSSSRISLKPGYLEAFTEGKTIRGKPTLIILLPDGERLGFKRISRTNTWDSTWKRIHTKARLVGVGDGVVVLYQHRGKSYPIYKFQKRSHAPKLISLKAKVEALAETMPDRIDNFMESNDDS